MIQCYRPKEANNRAAYAHSNDQTVVYFLAAGFGAALAGFGAGLGATAGGFVGSDDLEPGRGGKGGAFAAALAAGAAADSAGAAAAAGLADPRREAVRERPAPAAEATRGD